MSSSERSVKTDLNTTKFGVPCSKLKAYLDENDIPCTCENEAMALAAGAWLAGKHPTVYMQNSGFGNCVDIITSLYKPYGIPLPKLILSIRHKPLHHADMGKITHKLMKLLDYKHAIKIEQEK